MEGRDEAAVREAIERALAAEREASDAVAKCAREAETLLREAHARAATIARRAEQRIAALHERHGQERERQIAAHLAVGMHAGPSPDPRQEEERTRRAVARLATQLTGSGS